MAETESHKPGVIRSTRDYLQTPESPAPGSDDSEDARGNSPVSTLSGDDDSSTVSTTRENPRELRNRAEKQRRDRLNQSVGELAAMVPPVVAARRKLDKTTVLRLTAHYLRAHQYVFGDSIGQAPQEFNPASIHRVLSLFNGFLITTTYRGIIVVVSQNVHQYLGYSELDLLGQNLLNITHEADRAILRDQLMPQSQTLGPNGELVIPDEPNAIRRVEEELTQEKRSFVIRLVPIKLKKMGQRSEPNQYVTCHVEGSLRKSDRACQGNNRCCQIVRRARARSENPCSSGNDIVFIGIVRPTSETFINESALESYRMEYRTRHSIDGEIIQCEARIALVTGYMTHEVSGVNAMNFMHRDDVRWVIIALREMYDQHRLFGESCYRLITKNGQFIYMRTRGCLDVDRRSRQVTSFVCTNTVVTEEEGKQLIRLMKRKFTLMVNNNEASALDDFDDDHRYFDTNDDERAPVEDPRRLEEVILHLVTNLPSPSPQEDEEEPSTSALDILSPQRLTIIPPNRERIVSAIEKIYTVMTVTKKVPELEGKDKKNHLKAITFHMEPESLENGQASPSNSGQLVPFESSNTINFLQTVESSLTQSLNLNGTENEFTSSVRVNAAPSPDMGYFEAPPSPFSGLSSILTDFVQNGENILHDQHTADLYQIQSQETSLEITVPMAPFANESSIFEAEPQPSTSRFPCGTKRRNESDDTNMVYKRMNTGLGQNTEVPNLEMALEELIDDSLLNSEYIESAIGSLESFDPSVPDLLNSTDIQDILAQIEQEAEQPNYEDFDLSKLI